MATSHAPHSRSVHLAAAVHPTPAQIKRAVAEVDGLNEKLAVLITRVVGSMWCAYAFALLALEGLPAALRPGGQGLVAWSAQTFLQLVLLSVILVGQNQNALVADERTEQTFEDTEKILDRLDDHTQGGIRTVLDRLDDIEDRIAWMAPQHDSPNR